MFALVDGNNFYASCERIFQPALRGKPLVVLSNNDGCAIARSAEAKALGVKMGHPAHDLKHMVKHQGLQMRSANFGLYGDISARIVSILRAAAPRVEVYSIDESFMDITGIRQREQFARDLRHRVRLWTGIPNCIGIGPTKTLAKLANKAAKSGDGVMDLGDTFVRDAVLASFPIEDVWGVGRRLAPKLAARGIQTAAQLRDARTDDIFAAFGVTLTRTQRELQGLPCMELEEVEPDRQQIVVSRSFGNRVCDNSALYEALATFTVRACEKLRHRDLVASGVGIFLSSDTFRPELPQHHPSRAITMAASTSDTSLVLKCVRQLFAGLPREGIGYKKAGVMLMDLARPEALQQDLFNAAAVGNDKLMATLDSINAKFGRGTAGFGASGWQATPQWSMRQQMLSPRYTTSVHELPRVKC
ncbi:DNA polymerase [Stenotrophomonas terrae]|uniref:DNA polymerase n=1 Tax=Stenotrophomonas terrae TaxID=405446 RepID=A0A0R0CIP0_9GAMM|nr:Y-family DNA polymerase [Stenotrophomonas terrae]KRG65790.1 DNA polymerase [Stenotrophomonas terrae]